MVRFRSPLSFIPDPLLGLFPNAHYNGLAPDAALGSLTAMPEHRRRRAYLHLTCSFEELTGSSQDALKLFQYKTLEVNDSILEINDRILEINDSILEINDWILEINN